MTAGTGWVAAFLAMALRDLEPPPRNSVTLHHPRMRHLNQRQRRRDARRSGMFSARKRRNK